MSASPTILVTGAHGQVGSEAVRGLRGLNVSVISVGHSTGSKRCDITSTDEVVQLLSHYRPETIIHAAYLLADRTNTDLVGGARTNVVGFLNMLEAAEHVGVKSFMYASSIAVYGKQEAAAETSPTMPSTIYGVMKLLNELQAEARANVFERYCGIRISNVYDDLVGRGQTGWLSTAVHQALRGQPTQVELAPDARMSIIWARDLGKRISSAVLSDRDWPPIVDSGGEPIAGRQIVEHLREVGSPEVAQGASAYPYPYVVGGAWLDEVRGSKVLGFRAALSSLQGH